MSDALVYLATQTASGGLTLAFTSLISSAYDEYMLEIINLVPVTDGASFGIQYSTDNGSTYAAGTSYDWASQNWVSGGLTGGGADKAMYFTQSQSSGGNSSACARVYLTSPLSSSLKKYIHGTSIGAITSGTSLRNIQFCGCYHLTTAVNALRIMEDQNTGITSGVVRLYGISPSPPPDPFGANVISDDERGGFQIIGCPFLQ